MYKEHGTKYYMYPHFVNEDRTVKNYNDRASLNAYFSDRLHVQLIKVLEWGCLSLGAYVFFLFFFSNRFVKRNKILHTEERKKSHPSKL